MADTSTDSAVKRWLEFYGPIDKENICKFLGVGTTWWYSKRGLREKLKSNFIESINKGE